MLDEKNFSRTYLAVRPEEFLQGEEEKGGLACDPDGLRDEGLI